MTSSNTVICIHGIWSHGVSMYLIKRRLEREYGYNVQLFNYPSVRGSLDDNADLLSRFIADQGLDAANIIGHSLGGVIALRMLSNHSDTVPGRLVCIGSPLVGSRAASFLHAQDWAAPFVGQSLSAGVVDKAANEWATHVCEQRDVGIIAGTSPYGFGRLITTFDGENDGSVAVAETRLEGAKDHICMDVSHKSMLVSAGVVDQAAAFLKRGEFLREDL